MIVSEHNIRDIINTIPAVCLNDSITQKAKFHWGDDKELNRYIELNKEDSYPLIWLLPSPNHYKHRGKQLYKKCEFVIATREKVKDLFNDERYLKSFDVVLNPLTEKLIHGLKSSSISELNGEDWNIMNFPNYSNMDKNATIDLWDAVKLVIDVKFTEGGCLRDIKYEK